ncbi:MAG: shikimate dehydrogenase [Phycisphaerae bacterium]|nr:shikimate dehydrogenase [Phycisphaerae bacterium]
MKNNGLIMPATQRTLLAVPITAADTASARRQIQSAQAHRADILEFRLDHMAEADWPTLFDEASLPVIATLRPKDQGGRFSGSEDQRLELLAEIAKARPAFIDFEWPHFAASSRARQLISSITCDSLDADKPALILSLHDFQSVPSNLNETIARMSNAPAAIVKVVCMAQSIQDNLPLLDFAHQSARPAIILGMGQAGQISRVLAAKLGTFLSFSCLSLDESSAPGQIPLDQLRSVYRWDRITEQSLLFGVVGSPIAHSLSPAIHNAAFEQTDFAGLYLPFLVEPGYENFTQFMDGFLSRTWLDLRGLSVTIPHKENALRYLSDCTAEIDPLACKTGSLNTIVISPDGQLAGYNTDLDGALDALTDGMGITRSDLSGRKVAVLGAGGAARAIVVGLTQAGAQVLIYNRTASRAQRLAEEFAATAVPLAQLAKTPARIIINATSIGMHPDIQASPFPSDALKPDMTVFDTVYNPQQTLLLTQAAQAAATTISGTEMFIRQAAKQFELWTGQAAPIDTMHQVLYRALA